MSDKKRSEELREAAAECSRLSYEVDDAHPPFGQATGILQAAVLYLAAEQAATHEAIDRLRELLEERLPQPERCRFSVMGGTNLCSREINHKGACY